MTRLFVLLFFLPRILIAGDTLQITFVPEGGFFQGELQVKLSFPPEANKIYYTLDGSTPSKASKRYSEPIQIKKTTVIRAIAYSDDGRTKTQTNTYLFGRSFTLPIVSIATDPDNFFGYERGIYAKGCCADTVPPYYGANFWKGWERPINIEYFEPDGKQAINQQAGARIFGGFSKGLPMKSLSIFARKKYGKKHFKHQLFKEKPDIKKYKSFILRNSGGDFNNTHFRDALITQLTRPTELPIQAYQPTVVFINGNYWGIHNAREKLNEHYFKFNFGADEDSIDLMKHRNDIQLGTRDKYKELKTFITEHDLSQNAHIYELNKKMNIDNYIDHHIIQVYADNGDAGGNIRYWRPQRENGRWNWVLFDTDLGMGIGSRKAYKTNTLKEMTEMSDEKWPNPAWSTFIIRNLLENDSIKQVYILRFLNHLNTIYSEKSVCAKIDSLHQLLSEEMVYHKKRWGGRITTWNKNVERLKTFARNRPHFIREHMQEVFDLGDTINIEVTKPSAGAKNLWFNNIQVDDTLTGVYFKKTPLLVEVEVEAGFQHVGWKGSTSTRLRTTIYPESDLLIEPRLKKSDTSEYWEKVVFSEVRFCEDNDRPSGDWVELRNTSQQNIILDNWKIATSKNTKKRQISATTISPSGFLVLAKDSAAFCELMPEVNRENVVSCKRMKLKKSGFHLFLFDGEGALVDSIRVDPTNAECKTISLIEPTHNDHTTASWEYLPVSTPNSINTTEKIKKAKAEENEKQKRRTTLITTILIILGVSLLILHRLRKKSRSVL